MTLLHTIHVDGTVQSEDYKGELECQCPPWNYLKGLMGLSERDLLEHINVLWKGRHCHMFVNEEGRMNNLANNKKATRIYLNATLDRQGGVYRKYIYDDLNQDPTIDAVFIEEPGFDIVGTAILWEGNME